MTAASTALPRRELLLQAAARLFAQHGYHAVGIDDIGAAAGITGPGVYRHFPSKAALLQALTDRAVGGMTQGARAVVAEHTDAHDALVGLVDQHVAFVVEQRALIGVWARESRSLPDDLLRPVLRQQRAYEQPWREVVGRLRDDLSPAEVGVIVTATLAMLNGTPYLDPAVAADRVAALLRTMSLSALLAGRPPQD